MTEIGQRLADQGIALNTETDAKRLLKFTGMLLKLVYEVSG